MIRLRRLAPIVVCSGALALSSCASLNPFAPRQPAPTAPGPPLQILPPPPPQPAAPVPIPRPFHRAAAREPHHPAELPSAKSAPPQLALVQPQDLIGLRPDQVAARLGQPQEIAKDAPGLVWRYTAEGCGLRVYFFPDIKTNEFHVLKFSLAGADGKALDADAPCRRRLLALKDPNAG